MHWNFRSKHYFIQILWSGFRALYDCVEWKSLVSEEREVGASGSVETMVSLRPTEFRSRQLCETLFDEREVDVKLKIILILFNIFFRDGRLSQLKTLRSTKWPQFNRIRYRRWMKTVSDSNVSSESNIFVGIYQRWHFRFPTVWKCQNNIEKKYYHHILFNSKLEGIDFLTSSNKRCWLLGIVAQSCSLNVSHYYW